MSAERDEDLLRPFLSEMDSARTARDAETPAFLLDLRERLESERSAIPALTSRPRARVRWMLAAAAAVVVTTVTLALTLGSPQAEATSPVPLSFSAPASTQQVVTDAVHKLSSPEGVASPQRRVRAISWAISIEDGELRGPVVPQFVALDWDTDLSGQSVIVRGRTESVSDRGVGRVSATDEVLSEQTFAPGEFGVPSADVPAATEAGVAELLTMYGMPADPTAGQIVQSMVTVMSYWTLSDAQQAILLGILARTGEATSLGDSVDRLGRNVVGLRVASAVDGLSDTVLISAESGRIMGVETVRTEADEQVPSGTVVEYRMWDSEKEQ